MKFVIDRSKWRCGAYAEFSHGEGSTFLLNDAGYMCCLGMVSLQLGLKPKEIQDCKTPTCVNKNCLKTGKLDILVKRIPDSDDDYSYYRNNDLSNKAIEINDDSNLTPEEREFRLTELFKQHGHQLEFVNSYGE